jgi:hypothetical protein
LFLRGAVWVTSGRRFFIRCSCAHFVVVVVGSTLEQILFELLGAVDEPAVFNG